MTIDVKRIRPGDEVWLKGVVEKNDGHAHRPLNVRLDDDVTPIWIDPDCLIQHIPRAPRIGVGDRVKWRHGHHPDANHLRVLAIVEDDAWLEGDAGVRFTGKLECLERVS